MFGLFCFLLAVLASPFKSEAENAALRHQLTVVCTENLQIFWAPSFGNRNERMSAFGP